MARLTHPHRDADANADHRKPIADHANADFHKHSDLVAHCDAFNAGNHHGDTDDNPVDTNHSVSDHSVIEPDDSVADACGNDPCTFGLLIYLLYVPTRDPSHPAEIV